jgi:hypothetical protein
MRIVIASTALVSLALLAGCDPAPTPENATPPMTNVSQSVPAQPTAPATPMPIPMPTLTADDASMTIDDTAQGAAAVIRHYYADLDSGDFRAAYERWGNGGQDSHQSYTDFKRGFAETATTSVDVGPPGDSEGGAGSIYIDIPVTIHATLKNGTAQTFTGHYSLRRVNDVDGSTQAQRRWHIYSAALKKR